VGWSTAWRCKQGLALTLNIIESSASSPLLMVEQGHACCEIRVSGFWIFFPSDECGREKGEHKGQRLGTNRSDIKFDVGRSESNSYIGRIHTQNTQIILNSIQFNLIQIQV